MMTRMLDLCNVRGQQPTPQGISNLLIAFPQLRLALPKHQADALFSYLLTHSRPSHQHLANTAWGLAVCGGLKLSMFKQLLQYIHDLKECSGLPNGIEICQLYQALDWLAPGPDATQEHHKTWLELQTNALSLGPRPEPDSLRNTSKGLQAALTQLGLQFAIGAVVKGYRIDAVVESWCSCPSIHFIRHC